MKYISKLLNSFTEFIENQINKFEFSTYSYAIARSLFAFGSLCTLLLNNPIHLFNPTNIENPNHVLLPLNKISIFYIFDQHLYFVNVISVIILLITISGYRPKYTCIMHWWISFSISASSFVIEGGDHVSQIITLLLIPMCLTDNRKNHWNISDKNFKPNIFASYSYFLIRLQVAFIYLEASIGKLKIEEWKDGSVLYYWFTNSFVGSPLLISPITNFIIKSPLLLTSATWSSLVLEFLLFMCITSFRKQRNIFLFFGLFFHFFIFIFFGLFSFMFAMSGALLFYLSNFKKESI